jgi:hypothetical protein
MVLLLLLPSALVMARRTHRMAWLRLLLLFMAVEAVALLRDPSFSSAFTASISDTGRHVRPAGPGQAKAVGPGRQWHVCCCGLTAPS